VVPKDVAGYARSMAAGLADLGWRVDLVDLMANPLQYEDGGQPRGAVAALNAVARASRRRSGPARYMIWALGYPLRLWIGLTAPLRYEAVVVLAGAGLLAWNLDSRWARVFGVRVVTVFLGSDARPPCLSGHLMADPDDAALDAVRRSTRDASALVHRAERTSDHVVCHPAYAQFLRRPFVNWFAIGMPAARPARTRPRHAEPDGEFLILHAPTRPGPKGSAAIGAAVDQLRAEGLPVRLQMLHGVPNHQVVEAIERADLVVDQLYSDTPFPGFVTEAATLGCPVLTFGYAGTFLQPWLDRFGVPAGHFPAPSELLPALRRAVTDPQWRSEVLGAQAHRFVAEQSDRTATAARFARLLQGDVPPEWMVGPDRISYVAGWGIDRGRLAVSLRRYLDRHGEQALQLASEHPARAQVLALAAAAATPTAPAG
jgi:hypothetical protein